MVADNMDNLSAALASDLGKPPQEARGTEIVMTLQDIINVVKNVLPCVQANIG